MISIIEYQISNIVSLPHLTNTRHHNHNRVSSPMVSVSGIFKVFVSSFTRKRPTNNDGCVSNPEKPCAEGVERLENMKDLHEKKISEILRIYRDADVMSENVGLESKIGKKVVAPWS